MSINIPIEKDFYEMVEKPNYLKHILYGDSVLGESLVECIYKSEPLKISIEDLWVRLTAEFKVEEIEGKEYIIFPENCQALRIQNPDLKNDQIVFVPPKYLMRHKFKGTIYRNFMTNTLNVGTTMNHSYVEVNMKDRTFRKKNPVEIQVVPIVASSSLQVPLKYSLVYGHETKYDYYGAVRNTRANRQILTSLRPWKLCKKQREEFDGYVYDFEVPESHVFIVNDVVVHNTDSLFLEIPLD